MAFSETKCPTMLINGNIKISYRVWGCVLISPEATFIPDSVLKADHEDQVIGFQA